MPDKPQKLSFYQKLSYVHLIYHSEPQQGRPYYFRNNLAKCWPILIILSQLHFQIYCGKSWNKNYHLTSNVLLHLPYENLMLNSATLRHVIECECDTKSFIYSICLPEMLSTVSYVYCLHRLIYNIAACAKLIWSQKRRMVWVVHATGQWMRQWRVVKCCSASRQ